MNKRYSSRLAGPWLALALLLGCQSNGGTDPSGSVCPLCTPLAGGETGDFGGQDAAPTFCEKVSKSELVDREQALALGFGLAAQELRIARPIDESMRWQPQELRPSEGQPATGYLVDTRVKVSLVSTGIYQHWLPDPTFCDGSTCRFADEQQPQTACVDHLATQVAITFETSDGAVRGSGLAMAFPQSADRVWTRNLEPDGGLYMFAGGIDLRDIQGSLRLSPAKGALSYQGKFLLSLELGPDHARGSFSPQVVVTVVRPAYTSTTVSTANFDASVPAGTTDFSYAPLESSFPPVALSESRVDQSVFASASSWSAQMPQPW